MNKLFVTLAVLSVFGCVLVKGFDKKEALAKFMAKAEECKVEVGASDSDLSDMISHKPFATKEGKCLKACLVKHFNVMDSNGKFVESVALEHAEKYTEADPDKMKIAHEMMDACKNIDVSSDHCEAAAEYSACFMEQAKAHGIDHLEM